MSLELSTSDKSSTKSEKLIDAYLKSACKALNNLPKSDARLASQFFLLKDDQEFNTEFGKPSTKELLSGVKYEDVLKKESELKKQAKGASLKVKANYQFNIEPKKEEMFSFFGPSMAVLPGLAVLVNAAEQGSLTGVAVGFAGIGAAVGGVAAVQSVRRSLEAKDAAEQKQIDDYIAVKHSQLALKQLKKAIQKEQGTSYKQQVQQLFASGLGNPDGMITPLALQQKKGSSR